MAYAWFKRIRYLVHLYAAHFYIFLLLNAISINGNIGTVHCLSWAQRKIAPMKIYIFIYARELFFWRSSFSSNISFPMMNPICSKCKWININVNRGDFYCEFSHQFILKQLNDINLVSAEKVFMKIRKRFLHRTTDTETTTNFLPQIYGTDIADCCFEDDNRKNINQYSIQSYVISCMLAVRKA